MISKVNELDNIEYVSKTDFEKYLKRGLGKCALSLKDDLARKQFYKTVLNACTKDISYDLQSEGTKARFVFNLISFYPDASPFIEHTIDAFNKLEHSKLDDFLHVSELLSLFAKDGNTKCKNALIEKYEQLLSTLKGKKYATGYDYARDKAEQLAIFLLQIDGEQMLIRCARDFGTLFATNKKYNFEAFDYLKDCILCDFGYKNAVKIIKNACKDDQDALLFCSLLNNENQTDVEGVQAANELPEKFITNLIQDIKRNQKVTPAIKVKFKKFATEKDKQRICNHLIKEIKLSKKLEYLTLLECDIQCVPCDVMLSYATSPLIPLRKRALQLLTDYTHPDVRSFAINLIYGTDEDIVQTTCMLIQNYTPKDKDLLHVLLNSLEGARTDNEGRHEISIKILKCIEKNKALPKEFLLFVYKNSPCARCRYKAVKHISKTV